MNKPGDLPIFLIAIDGHGGSGKSTLADLLSEKLGAEIIHRDDFGGPYNPPEWWPLIFERVFSPIKNGEKFLNYPRAKYWESHHPEPVVDQPVTQIMILEGVSSLRKEFRPFINYGIFVDTLPEIFLQREFERTDDQNPDQHPDGKTDDEMWEILQGWYEKELDHFKKDQPRDFADLIVDGTKPFLEQIDLKKFKS